MPRILSRSQIHSKKRRSRHSMSSASGLSCGESSSYPGYSQNASWADVPPRNAVPLSSPNLLRLVQQRQIHVGPSEQQAQVSKESLDKIKQMIQHPRKASSDHQRASSPGSTIIGTSCDNSVTSEHTLQTFTNLSVSNSSKSSFLPKVPSACDDWGQYVDVCEPSSPKFSTLRTMPRRKPEWKRYFH